MIASILFILIGSILSDDNYRYQRVHNCITYPRKSDNSCSEVHFPSTQRTGGLRRCLMLEDSRGIFRQVQEYLRISNQDTIKSNKIINGEKIEEKHLSDIEKYCNQEERSKVLQIAQNNKGIQAYWFTVILNYFKQSLTLGDKQIATAITNIKTTLSATCFEITFYFGKNDLLSSQKITKRYISDQSNDVLRIEGDNAQWINGKPQGIFGGFLSEANPQENTQNYQLANEFINEIVPYSLQHFLGVAEQICMQGQQEADDEDEESDQDEEQLKSESEPKKKTKK